MRVDDRPSDPRDLRELANSSEVQDELKKLALAIRDDARQLAPRRTGNLRRHIDIEKVTDLDTGVDGYAVGWEDDAFYGPFVEKGGERRRPRPHLVPAAIKNGVTGPGGDE
jgi:HK97 gp10 family phage protein